MGDRTGNGLFFCGVELSTAAAESLYAGDSFMDAFYRDGSVQFHIRIFAGLGIRGEAGLVLVQCELEFSISYIRHKRGRKTL